MQKVFGVFVTLMILGMSSKGFTNVDLTCTGSVGSSGASVIGICSSGSFSGTVAASGDGVYGSCGDGYWSGTVMSTGESASGSCF